MNKGSNKNISLVFESMRFPLIVLILYMHIVKLEHFPISQEISWTNAYNFLAEYVSHVVGRLAVPSFFVISGYFYFFKIRDWSKNFYLNQQNKRIKTLLIPYLLWNVILIVLTLIKGFTLNKIGLNGSSDLNYIFSTPLLEHFLLPINQPLWYLRDLICMTFISPLFYYYIKYTNKYGIILLYILYLSTLELPFRGFSMTSIFYFYLGSYAAIRKVDIIRICQSIKIPAYIISIITSLVTTLLNQTIYFEFVVRLFALFGLISAINLTYYFIDNKNFRDVTLKMSSSVFFIYAVHELFLKNWIKGAFSRIAIFNIGVGQTVGYIVMPIILLFICIVIYNLMKKITPKTLTILTGGRL